jgi:hypothetical protein
VNIVSKDATEAFRITHLLQLDHTRDTQNRLRRERAAIEPENVARAAVVGQKFALVVVVNQ